MSFIPWSLIFNLITKVILMFIDKKQANDEARKNFLLFLDNIQKDVSVKVREDYQKQIDDLKKQLNK